MRWEGQGPGRRGGVGASAAGGRGRGRLRDRRAARIGALAPALALALACGPEPARTEPEVITAVSPFEYPVALWDRRIEGETVLMVYVTEMGGVDSVYVHESSGQPAFDSAALAGAIKLRFRPARRGEERVARWARLPVRFHLPHGEPTGGAER